MKIINEASMLQLSCLGKQIYDKSKQYRPIKYSMHIEADDGLLLYNNLTDELVFLEKSELKDIKITNSEISRYLIEKWYLIPNEYDEVKLCDQVNRFMYSLVDSQKLSFQRPITDYTVLTTTDCNARCFYCYEMGRSRIAMTEEVANDVADFIIRACKGHSVTFRWFGGEPLYNAKVIDIICNKLINNNIKFKSNMISNGYLFDEETIEKAKSVWNLEMVQITLDGTEDVYNRCKAFIYKEGSAYQRVMRNIKLLLDANINVKIRMNADEHNLDDLFDLTDILAEKFGMYSNITVYSHLLFDNGENTISEKKHAERYAQHSKLSSYIRSKGFDIKYTLSGYHRYHQCMADNPQATTVLPDGHLGRCEHFSESEFWGSIYSDEIDFEVVNRFKKIRSFTDRCDDCPLRPACTKLEICPDQPIVCDEFIQNISLTNTLSRITNTYNEYNENR